MATQFDTTTIRLNTSTAQFDDLVPRINRMASLLEQVSDIGSAGKDQIAALLPRMDRISALLAEVADAGSVNRGRLDVLAQKVVRVSSQLEQGTDSEKADE